jgi:hypothetical protein
VELLKTATFLGELAANQFDPWDQIEPPPGEVLTRLGIHSVENLVSRCRQSLHSTRLEAGANPARGVISSRKRTAAPAVAYRCLHDGADWLPLLIASADVQLTPVQGDLSEINEPLLCNAVGVPLPQVIAKIRRCGSSDLMILADAASSERLNSYGRVLTVPASFGLIQGVCRHLANSKAPTSDLAMNSLCG